MNISNYNLKILISVCIVTYNRPKLLAKLLNSLNDQVLDNNIDLEIIIVDNDKFNSAYSTVEQFESSSKSKVIYLTKTEKNISLGRNEAIKNASGKFIAFIDDDEEASKDWILNLYNCIQIYNADAVFGYVEPKFTSDTPPWVQKRELYFSPMSETGTVAKFTFTTNVIIRTNIIKEKKIIFEPSYGITGGGDPHFFERLREKGALLINCHEAITYEFIPAKRTKKRYLYSRSLRGGQAFMRRQIESNKKIVFIIKIFIKSLLVILISGILLLFSTWFRSFNLKMLQMFGANIGKVRALLGVYKQHF